MQKRRRVKNKRNDRNFSVGPMTALEQIPLPDDAKKLGYVGAYENNKYGVFIKPSESEGINGFMMPGDDGRQQPMTIMHMVIIKLDHRKHTVWEEIQDMKSELLGPMCEAVEIYPSEIRRMHNIVDHQTHLWALVPGATFPLGLVPKAMEKMQKRTEDLTVSKEDLQVYVIKGDVSEVFASEAEAKRSYDKNEVDFPGGDIMMIGDAPVESESSAWSEGAHKKIAVVLSKSQQMTDALKDGKDDDEMVVSSVVVNTNGPRTENDEFEEDAIGVIDDVNEPRGIEEDVMMPEFMAIGVEQMERNREDAVRNAQTKILADIDEKEKTKKEDVEKELIATKELAGERAKVIAEKEKQ